MQGFQSYSWDAHASIPTLANGRWLHVHLKAIRVWAQPNPLGLSARAIYASPVGAWTGTQIWCCARPRGCVTTRGSLAAVSARPTSSSPVSNSSSDPTPFGQTQRPKVAHLIPYAADDRSQPPAKRTRLSRSLTDRRIPERADADATCNTEGGRSENQSHQSHSAGDSPAQASASSGTANLPGWQSRGEHPDTPAAQPTKSRRVARRARQPAHDTTGDEGTAAAQTSSRSDPAEAKGAAAEVARVGALAAEREFSAPVGARAGATGRSDPPASSSSSSSKQDVAVVKVPARDDAASRDASSPRKVVKRPLTTALRQGGGASATRRAAADGAGAARSASGRSDGDDEDRSATARTTAASAEQSTRSGAQAATEPERTAGPPSILGPAASTALSVVRTAKADGGRRGAQTRTGEPVSGVSSRPPRTARAAGGDQPEEASAQSPSRRGAGAGPEGPSGAAQQASGSERPSGSSGQSGQFGQLGLPEASPERGVPVRRRSGLRAAGQSSGGTVAASAFSPSAPDPAQGAGPPAATPTGRREQSAGEEVDSRTSQPGTRRVGKVLHRVAPMRPPGAGAPKADSPASSTTTTTTTNRSGSRDSAAAAGGSQVWAASEGRLGWALQLRSRNASSAGNGRGSSTATATATAATASKRGTVAGPNTGRSRRDAPGAPPPPSGAPGRGEEAEGDASGVDPSPPVGSANRLDRPREDRPSSSIDSTTDHKRPGSSGGGSRGTGNFGREGSGEGGSGEGSSRSSSAPGAQPGEAGRHITTKVPGINGSDSGGDSSSSGSAFGPTQKHRFLRGQRADGEPCTSSGHERQQQQQLQRRPAAADRDPRDRRVVSLLRKVIAAGDTAGYGAASKATAAARADWKAQPGGRSWDQRPNAWRTSYTPMCFADVYPDVDTFAAGVRQEAAGWHPLVISAGFNHVVQLSDAMQRQRQRQRQGFHRSGPGGDEDAQRLLLMRTFRALQTAFLPHVATLRTGRYASNALWVCGKVGDWGPGDQFLEAILARLRTPLDGVPYGLLRVPQHGQLHSNLWWGLSQYADPDPEGPGGSGSGSILGFVNSGSKITNCDRWLDILETSAAVIKSQKVLDPASYKPQELANLILAAARMGFRSDPAFIDLLLRHFIKHEGPFKPQAVSNIIYALGELYGNRLMVVHSGSTPGLARDAATSAERGAEVAAAVGATSAADERRGDEDEEEDADGVDSGADAGAVRPRQAVALHPVCVAHIRSLLDMALTKIGLHSFNEQELSNMLYSMAKQGVLLKFAGFANEWDITLAAELPQTAYQACGAFAVHLTEQIKHRWQTAHHHIIPQGISNVLYALACMGHPAARSCCDLAVELVLRHGRMDGGSPQEWATLFWGLGNMRYRPPEALVARWEQELPRWGAAGVRVWALTGWSVAVLDLRSDALMDWACDYAAQHAGDILTGDHVALSSLTNVLWALSLMPEGSLVRYAELQRLVVDALNGSRPENLEDGIGFFQIWQAHLEIEAALAEHKQQQKRKAPGRAAGGHKPAAAAAAAEDDDDLPLRSLSPAWVAAARACVRNQTDYMKTRRASALEWAVSRGMHSLMALSQRQHKRATGRGGPQTVSLATAAGASLPSSALECGESSEGPSGELEPSFWSTLSAEYESPFSSWEEEGESAAEDSESRVPASRGAGAGAGSASASWAGGKRRPRQVAVVDVSPLVFDAHITRIEQEWLVEALYMRNDLCVWLSDGRRVAVEVDGPTHFFENEPQRLEPRALLRNRQLGRVFGPDYVKVVRYFEWDTCASPQDELAYLARLLGIVRVEPPTANAERGE